MFFFEEIKKKRDFEAVNSLLPNLSFKSFLQLIKDFLFYLFKSLKPADLHSQNEKMVFFKSQ